MQGSILKRGSSYTVYWSTIDPATGNRVQHSKGGFTKKEPSRPPKDDSAREFLNSIVGKVQSGEWKRDTNITVKTLLEDHWLPAQQIRGLRPSTIAQYKGAVEWYLVPRLGGTKVGALKPADVAKLVDYMRTAKSSQGRKGLSVRTAQIAVVTLKSATKWALANGMLGRDPLAGVTAPRREHKPMNSWSDEDARKFLAHVRTDRLGVAYALFLTRGFRRGELAGLRWDAVNFTEGTIQITRTRITVDGKAMDSTPKTGAGRRTVPMDASLVSMLRVHEVAQKKERLKAGDVWQGIGHVFVNEVGQPHHPDHFGDRFEDLVKECGVPRIRLHDLRHTACSLMLAAGEPVKVVQELVGHASPQITLALYTHTTPSMGRDAGAALSERLLG